MFKEFKTFIAKGNVVDLAVGVIIGGAFGKIVSSLVNDILMPMIGILIGGVDFSNLVLKIGNAKVSYGLFIQNVIDFLIIAFCVFMFVQVINKLSSFTKKEEKNQIKEEKKIESKEDVQLTILKEIRDELKKQNQRPKKTNKESNKKNNSN